MGRTPTNRADFHPPVLTNLRLQRLDSQRPNLQLPRHVLDTQPQP
ncbi:hypothetical protein LINPERPRIM_LOCUS16385 [Linum perenne]